MALHSLYCDYNDYVGHEEICMMKRVIFSLWTDGDYTTADDGQRTEICIHGGGGGAVILTEQQLFRG